MSFGASVQACLSPVGLASGFAVAFLIIEKPRISIQSRHNLHCGQIKVQVRKLYRDYRSRFRFSDDLQEPTETSESFQNVYIYRLRRKNFLQKWTILDLHLKLKSWKTDISNLYRNNDPISCFIIAY